jgi:hypothetical protein
MFATAYPKPSKEMGICSCIFAMLQSIAKVLTKNVYFLVWESNPAIHVKGNDFYH